LEDFVDEIIRNSVDVKLKIILLILNKNIFSYVNIEVQQNLKLKMYILYWQIK